MAGPELAVAFGKFGKAFFICHSHIARALHDDSFEIFRAHDAAHARFAIAADAFGSRVDIGIAHEVLAGRPDAGRFAVAKTLADF